MRNFRKGCAKDKASRTVDQRCCPKLEAWRLRLVQARKLARQTLVSDGFLKPCALTLGSGCLQKGGAASCMLALWILWLLVRTACWLR